MTTPAGWYDDGSGNQRWWDGLQWTEHVVTAPKDAPAESASVAETTPEQEPFEPPFVAPAHDAPTPQNAQNPHASAGASSGIYPAPLQSTGSLPPSAPTPPRRVSVLGLIGLIAAVVGVVLACIPPIAVAGWIVLALALVVSVVSLFLRGSKWPGITGIGVTALGAVLAFVVSLVSLGIGSIVEAGTGSSTPSPRPSADAGPTSEDDGSAETGDDPADIEGAEMVAFADLEVGDCIPFVEYDPESESIYEVPVVPCDRPHTDEVFFMYQMDDGEYPGDDAAYDLAWDSCYAQFEAFVGIPYEDSELDFYTYTPTKQSWARASDRTVHCIVFSYEDVTGTLEGAGR